jgi:hypothetical protein
VSEGPGRDGGREANGREPETADFSAVRVQGPRRWQPILVAAWLVALGGMVALGLSGRSADSGTGTGAVPSIGQSVSARPSATTQPTLIARFPGFPADVTPVQTSGPGPIQLQAQRHASSVFVHGDIYAPDITWVFFSLQGPDGRVAGWASVSVPGSVGPAAASGGPAMRFDVELAVPSDFNEGTLLVVAHAYNAHGVLVSATSVNLRNGPPAPTG